MLSDSEQRRLTEIESGLRADDPAFLQRFEGRRHRSRRWWRGTVALLGLSIAVTVAGFGLALRNVGTALAALTVIGVATAIWVVQGRRRRRT